MSDFAKEKVAFAVALLAVLFTITPVVDSVGEAGLNLFAITLRIRHVYYFLSILLALSVYSYAIQFVTERRLRLARVAGDIFYAMAIVAPALYVALFLVVPLANRVGAFLRSPEAAKATEVVLSMVAGSLSTLGIFLARRALTTKEEQSTAAQLERQEILFLREAEELFQGGHYDMAVIESFKAVETAASRIASGQRPVAPRHWTDFAKNALRSEDLIAAFERLKRVRNLAAHGTEPTTKNAAREALAIADKIVASLRPDTA